MALVPIATVKQALQISHSQTDDYLNLLIEGVQEFVAEHCGVSLWENAGEDARIDYLDGKNSRWLWPASLPIISVTSILDTENDDERNTDHETYGTRTRIYRENDALWAPGEGRWKVTYKGGYGPATIPNALKLAVVEIVVRAFRGRGGVDHQSAAGYGFDFGDLLDSGLIKRLNRFKLSVDVG